MENKDSETAKRFILSGLRKEMKEKKNLVKIEFECFDCDEFCYIELEKGTRFSVPVCRSCQTPMDSFKVMI